MDSNGTRFHLLHGKADWHTCIETEAHGAGAPGVWTDLAWDAGDRSLRLDRRPRPLPGRPGGPGGNAPSPEARRGAALDAYGNLYWIDAARRGLYRLPTGSPRPTPFGRAETGPAPEPGGFTPVREPQAPTSLAGLTVTRGHYLLVGATMDATEGTTGAVLVFDLHSGGPAARLSLPASFRPFAITAAPDGGARVLDREQRRVWTLDAGLRPQSTPPPASASATGFHGPDGAPCPPAPSPAAPPPLAVADPIALAVLEDGTLVVLDNPPGGPPRLHCYDPSGTHFPLSPAGIPAGAYDLAADRKDDLLYVADAAAGRILTYRLRAGSPPDLEPVAGTWPLFAFAGRGLVSDPQGGVRYDLGRVGNDAGARWPAATTLPERFRYARRAQCIGPPLDGRERECHWDALFLDARIPPGTEVRVAVRSHNDRELLAAAPFLEQPPLYLRGMGAEVPYYWPYADCETPPPGAGTHEVLLQEVRGRWLQVRLELVGDGRATPLLRTLRVYYPRFSYSERYLPAVYREDPTSASFLERLLANFKGFHTYIEGRIAAVGMWLDPRSAPPEALDWLAGWLGLALDPLWGELHQRTATPPRGDRRRLFLRLAPLMFERRGTPAGLRLALHLLLDPCLETLLERFDQARTLPDPGLETQLRRLGLPLPDTDLDDQALMALFAAYLASPRRPTRIRLREQLPVGIEAAGASPHRFSVLLPEGMDAELLGMAERIVELEKPAHTAYELRSYGEGFRIGEARLGLDSLLGERAAFEPVRLGEAILGDGFLAAPPLSGRDRLLLDRNPPGAVPP